jgi:hypothetical protein
MNRLRWMSDRVLFNDLVFLLVDTSSPEQPANECFFFHKPKRLMMQYDELWRGKPAFRPARILELGLFDGGSLAFWFEYFRPEKIVGLDKSPRGDSAYFRRFLAGSDREARIRTFWGTNQSDRKRLREIVAEELGGSIDLVIDDASHRYEETKASFETLFPLVRPGGLYIIEDWSWACWSGFKQGILPDGSELPPLVFQLIEATGSMCGYLEGSGHAQTVKPLIANVTVYPDFVVVERGPADAPATGDLDLERSITRSPQYARTSRLRSSSSRSDGRRLPSDRWWRFW